MGNYLLKNTKQTPIAIDKLRNSPLNSYSMDDMPELVGSIKSCGLIEPLSIIGPDEDGYYEVLSGNRRLHALRGINEETGEYSFVPCHIVGTFDMTELEQKLVIETANVETRDFDKNAKIFAILDIIKEMQKDGCASSSFYVKELKKYIGSSDRYRRAIVALSNSGDDELINLAKNGQGSIMSLATIANMNEDERKSATAKIKEGESASRILNDYRAKKKEEQDKAIKRALREEESNINQDEVDIDAIMKHIDDYGSTDDALQVDTTGLFKSLSKEESYNDKLNYITKWCTRMKNKSEYSYEEETALNAVLDLAEYISSVGKEIAM